MHSLMHISLGLALLGAVVAAPAPAPHRVMPRRTLGNAGFVAQRQANNTAQAPSETQIRNAVMGWMMDTGKVTMFMNTATSFTGDEYTRQAQIALNAELDELNHKKILDAGLNSDPNVQAANEVLENQGTFQNVVDVLQNMVNNGPDTAQADVDAINNNRCVNVLPNIDAYFAAAGMPEVSAVRPTGCLEVEGAPEATAVPNPAQPVAQQPGNGADVTEAPAQATDISSSSANAEGTSTSATAASEETSSSAEAAEATSSDVNEAASATSSASASATSD